jgi:hypothetical protein
MPLGEIKQTEPLSSCQARHVITSRDTVDPLLCPHGEAERRVAAEATTQHARIGGSPVLLVVYLYATEREEFYSTQYSIGRGRSTQQIWTSISQGSLVISYR